MNSDSTKSTKKTGETDKKLIRLRQNKITFMSQRTLSRKPNAL